ncbi:MAG: molecular chaperone HtpG [Rhodospirillales bacterium]|nr:molecular chaperone HtpG [Alphaproteobacteria bacterium]MBL6947098.1 molecular chaperone HtpG [Rhodospirillales bacterium]
MAQEKFTFQAEVSKLLDIVAHSLYSQKEIFLRELISNASDACDKLRYAALTEPKLIDGDSEFRVTLSIDKKAKTLTVSDNGTGMGHDDLTDLLGTIARSGTQAFAEQIAAEAEATKDKKGKGKGKGKDKDADMSLIGQFGVGFYSAFMVADKVDVRTRKAGEDKAWLWSSDGRGEFTIDEAERDGRGTDVIIHLSKKEEEYLEPLRLETIVKQHSDHISIPIVLKGSGEDGEEDRTLNTASALWTRPKKDISAEQYKEFYSHVSHAFDEPWLTLHNSVEGMVSYTSLLFIPSAQPFDLFHPDRKAQVKLYVKRVFITDDCEGLMPPYLRFMRGIVDSEDLPLNISREMFQHNPLLAKIRSGLAKRIMGELKKKAEKKPDEYAEFWENFGSVLKEGLYEEPENRERILALTRFKSTTQEGLSSLEDYVSRMKTGQDVIYYMTGDSVEAMQASAHLEGFKSKGVEVLLMTDPVDDFWIPSVGEYEGKEFKSATRAGADLDKIGKDGKKDKKKDDAKDTDKSKAAGEIEPLLAQFKVALGDAVKDVRASERLTESPVCLVTGEGDMDARLEKMLKQNRPAGGPDLTPRVLEINPGHALIKGLNARAKTGDGQDSLIADAAYLLLDQARIIEGEPVGDPQAFSRRLSAVMESGLKV